MLKFVVFGIIIKLFEIFLFLLFYLFLYSIDHIFKLLITTKIPFTIKGDTLSICSTNVTYYSATVINTLPRTVPTSAR